jgi:hypothetical protein
MTRLASNEPHILRSETIGEAWFAVAGRIVEDGVASRYGDLPIREIALVTLAVARRTATPLGCSTMSTPDGTRSDG